MNKENLTLEFTEDIKQKIFEGKYKIGDSLPPLRKLAQEYAVSRSVINVGIARLDAQGYLKIHKRQKITVNDYLAKGSLDVIRDMAFCSNKDYKNKATGDILAARKLIELESVKLASNRCQVKQLMLLDNIINKEEKLVLAEINDYVEIARADFSFHYQLIRLSANGVYMAFMNSFKGTAIKMTTEFYKKNTNVFSYYVDKHKLILQAIKNGDAKKAAELLQEILEHGEKAYKDYNL